MNERRGPENIELPSLPFLPSHRVFLQNDHLHLLGAGKTWGGHAMVEGGISPCAGSCVDTRAPLSVCPFRRGSATHAGAPVCERGPGVSLCRRVLSWAVFSPRPVAAASQERNNQKSMA